MRIVIACEIENIFARYATESRPGYELCILPRCGHAASKRDLGLQYPRTGRSRDDNVERMFMRMRETCFAR